MIGNTQQLLIRACKRSNSKECLLRVYKRFYLGSYCTEKEALVALSSILSGVVDDYTPMKIATVVTKLSSGDYRCDEYYERVFYMLRDQIAHTKAADFPGLRKPAWLRNRN